MRVPRGAGFAIKVGFSLGLLIVLAVRLDLSTVARNVGRASWPLLAGAAALLLASHVLGSVQWGTLLRAQGVDAPASRVLKAYFVGLFFNNFLPANLGGDLARVSSVAGYSAGLSPVVSATVMDRLMGFFVIAGFGIVALPSSVREMHEPLIPVLIVVSFAGAAAALVGARSRRMLALATLPLKLAGATALAERAERGATSLSRLAARAPLLLGVLLLAVAIQVFRVYAHYLVARALGIRLSQAALWTFVPILAVVAALPVSLNGLGVREWAATVLLPSAGVSSASAFAWQLVTYLLAVALSLAGAGAFLRGGLRAAARRAATEAAALGTGGS